MDFFDEDAERQDTRLFCCACQPRKCCCCLDVKTGVTIIGLSQLFVFPVAIVCRSLLLLNYYQLSLMICPLACFLVFLRLTRNDSEFNRYLFHKSLVYSFIAEYTIYIGVNVVFLILDRRESACDAYSGDNEYFIEILCGYWYWVLSGAMELAVLACKIYFIVITRQNWQNLLEGVGNNVREAEK